MKKIFKWLYNTFWGDLDVPVCPPLVRRILADDKLTEELYAAQKKANNGEEAIIEVDGQKYSVTRAMKSKAYIDRLKAEIK